MPTFAVIIANHRFTKREGIDLDRSTMADWVGKSTTLLEPHGLMRLATYPQVLHYFCWMIRR